MKLRLMLCFVLVASCGPERSPAVYVPADLLAPPPGWQGGPPQTNGAWIDAAATEKRGLQQCTGQLLTIAEILKAAAK